MNLRRLIWAGTTLIGIAATAVHAEQPAGTPSPAPSPARHAPEEDREARIAAQGLTALSAIARQAKQLGDWENEYPQFATSIDRVFAQNGWTDEPNEFIRTTMLEVGRIPPWDLNARMDKLVERIAGRYEMTAQQRTEFQRRLTREVGAMAFENAATLFKHAREFVRVRTNNEAFSAEGIARWTKESEGLLTQARTRLEKLSEDMSPTFTPEQRAIQDRDMNAFRKRMARMDEMRARWAAGGWKPEDFGFNPRPAQEPAPLPLPQAAPAVADAPPPYDAFDETTWERYVRLFIAGYGLDEGQALSALSILDEVQDRAQNYRRVHGTALAVADVAQRDADPLYAPIRALFAELQRRVEPIPTTAQRRAFLAGSPQEKSER
jgi:hypothetical protein